MIITADRSDGTTSQQPFTGMREIAEAPPVPRGPEDEPWNHPADGGEPLTGDLWRHDDAFGRFQSSEEFPDDLLQALRRVFERMYRAGFRDWESEGDYVEVNAWFLRRDLEVNAREVFRIWYGEDNWAEPFRTACFLQERGEVEYRLDHLLQKELGVAVRRQEVRAEQPPAVRRAARRGELPRDLRAQAPEFMKPGEFLTLKEIEARLAPRVEYRINLSNLYQMLSYHSRLFERLGRDEGGRSRARFALRSAS